MRLRGRAPWNVAGALVLLFAAGAAAAQNQPTIEARVTQVGLYEAMVRHTIDAPGEVEGRVYEVDYEFFSDATTVPARLGVRFGFEYRLEGLPKGATLPIREVMIFPPGGVRDPATGEVFLHTEWNIPQRVGDLCLMGFVLGSEWMILPGTWTAQVWYGNQKLAERQFTMAHP